MNALYGFCILGCVCIWVLVVVKLLFHCIVLVIHITDTRRMDGHLSMKQLQIKIWI